MLLVKGTMSLFIQKREENVRQETSFQGAYKWFIHKT